MEINSINITCSKCKKKCANTEADAHMIFGMCNHTNTWYKQCVECRKKYREYIQKNKKVILSCEHGHYAKSCAVCAKRCEHGKFFSNCLVCRPNRAKRMLCEHGLRRFGCKLCNLCTHNNHKRKCKQCVIDGYLKSAQSCESRTLRDDPILIKDKTN